MWRLHPAIRRVDQLSVGERAADYLRNGLGSWSFVFGALAFLGVWIGVNALLATGGDRTFGAYPFILLNLLLSCLAAMQGAILLIAAKRADQVSSELAAHDYAVNRRTEALIEENIGLTRAIKELTEGMYGKIVDPDPGAGVAAQDWSDSSAPRP